jgi:hypothetical protein
LMKLCASDEPKFDPKEYYKRGGRYQQIQHMFSAPGAVAPWAECNYQNHGDENARPD